MDKKIVIACDHAGNELKSAVIAHLEEKGYFVEDLGCDGTKSVNYPEYAHKVCAEIQNNNSKMGILICGTGIGMSIAANKHKCIRAALCSDEFSAEMTRRHNDANVLCMGARVIDRELALRLVDLFVGTEFEGGRHIPRVQMLNELDEQR